MKLPIIILISLLTFQSYAQSSKESTQRNNEYQDSFSRIGKSSKYGFVNNLGDTVIPIGKYKFLNPLDDEGMILATNYKDKQGFIDINENIIIPFNYEDLGVFSHNLTFAEKNGTFGYLNRKGKTIIDFQFSEAKYFYNPGLAIVKKESGWGLIDTLGNFKVDCIYDDIDYSRENQIAIVKKHNKWAFYFSDTETLTDFEFDEIIESSGRIPEKGHYSTIKELYFNRNIALVKKGNQFALIDKNLQQIVKYGTYDIINPMNCYGYSIVIKGNKYGIIDSLGNIKIPIEYDLISTKPARSYGNNFTTFLIKKNGKYQILNNQAELEIKKEFVKVDILSDNYYLAYSNDSIFLIDDDSKIVSNKYTGYYDFDEGFIVRLGNKMGTIDYKGNTILPFIYDSIFHPHLEDFLYAKKDGRFGVIDYDGKVVIPFEYEFITRVWYDDYEEYEDNLIVQKDKKLGTINMKNEINIPLIYDGICSWIEYSPDEHYVKKDNKYGMVKPNGEIMIPCLYDYIHYYNSQTILIERDNKFGVLNRENKEIVPCDYEKLIVDIDYWGFDENHKDKLVLLKDDVWYYLDLNGKLIAKNVAEDEILEKYPNAKKEIKYSLDNQLIMVE
ncbi:WG repeat-containing protein [Marinilabilia salmonicolor]|jgi:hypothetical protein|uniref:WG repeat-containing protein n=1 Tax=Marinilabilia salmonicolor TaxID=989 RepID=UPI000D0599F6|nr:WG repeat-containing protein [Marinilabilia salmonicolor]